MKLQLSQNLNLQLAQQLKMSPQLIQRIEILQLASLDLRELIQQEIMENEVLEMSESVEEIPKQQEEEKKDEIEDDGTMLEEDLERLSSLAEWNEGFRSQGSRVSGDDKDPKMEAMQNTASRPMTLQEHLKNQLDLTECEPTLRVIAEEIIYNINERGYLLYHFHGPF